MKRLLFGLLFFLVFANIVYGAPAVNGWLAPFDSTPAYLRGTQIIQVNVTDSVNPVDSVLIDINGTNLTMSQNGDIWSYSWNTDLYTEGLYNFVLFANNSISENTTSTLNNIYVDRTIPAVFNSVSGANPRDYIAAGTGFTAFVDTTDASPIKNVTCVLQGSVVEAGFVGGNQYSCALTAPSAQGDYTITFNSEDVVGNINSTSTSFTTKISTIGQVSANTIVISDLNQSNKPGVLIDGVLTNNGNSPMYDSIISIDPIESSIGTSPVYVKPCNDTVLDAGESCYATFNLTINGGVPPKDYVVFWTANWTDNNYNLKSRTPFDESIVTVLSNPLIDVPANVSLSMSHGTNTTSTIQIDAIGNDDLNDVGISYIQNSMPASWVGIGPYPTTITAGTSDSFKVTIVVPEFTLPGLYQGRLSVGATGAVTKYGDLFVNVSEDKAWTVTPSHIDAYVQSGTTGLVGTYLINNSGNSDHQYNISYNGTVFNYILDDSLRTDTISVARNSLGYLNIYIDQTIPLTSYFLNIGVTDDDSVHLLRTMNLYVDDDAPVISITNPANNAELIGLAEINTTITDLQLDGITFDISPIGACYNGSSPSGITIGPSLNDSYLWDTTAFCDANYRIMVTAVDAAGNQNQSSINVSLNNANEAPVVSSPIADFSFAEDTIDTSINLSNVFDDIDNDPLTYSYGILNNNTDVSVVIGIDDVVTLTPNPDYFGVLNVQFNASDGLQTASDDVLVTITNVNDAPGIPQLLEPSDDSIVKSNQNQVPLVWNFSDDVDNNVVTYNIYFSSNPASLSLLASYPYARNMPNGTENPVPSYNTPALTNGTAYYWQISANDGINESGNSTMYNFTYVFDNSPSINSWYWQTSAENSTTLTTITSAEGATLYFEANISDPDADDVNITWSDTFGGNTTDFAYDNITGSGIVNVNYIPGLLDAGSHIITVGVVDENGNSNSMSWDLTVTDSNQQPQIIPIPGQQFAEDTNFTLTNITQYFADPDPDNTLTYAVTQQNTSEVSCVLINGTDLLMISTPNWFGVGNDSASCGLVANDSVSTSIANIVSINITPMPDAPVLVIDDVIHAYEEIELVYDVNATDPDFDSISAFWSDSSLFTVNESTGVFSFTPVLAQVGNHSITFYVNDTTGLTTSRVVTLVVHFQNHNPILNPISDKDVDEETALQFTISAQDIDLTYGDVLNFTCNISDITVNKIGSTSAEVTWVPTSSYIGDNHVEFAVTDTEGAFDSQTVVIAVNDVNGAPVIESYDPLASDPKIPEDGSQTFTITKSDPENSPINVTWYLDGVPAGNADSYTYNGDGTPGINNHEVKVVVTDGDLDTTRIWALTTSDVPLSSDYTGTIVGLNPSQLDNATGITIQNSFTKVEFLDGLDLNDVVDIDNHVNLNLGIAGIDTAKYPTLKKPAKVTMYGLSHTNMPVIYYNPGFGASGSMVCPQTKCTNISYSGSTLTFNVDDFSTYWVSTAFNNMPLITSTPVTVAAVNTAYTYDVNAFDADSDPLMYYLTTSPTGMTINSVSGLISWTPSTLGNFPVEVSVSDGAAIATQNFTIAVMQELPAQSMLAIKDLDVEIDGEDDKNLDNGDKIGEDARPGSEVEFSVEIENEFTENIDIEDISVNVNIKDIDDGDDIEEDSSEFDLDDGEDERVTLSFNLPLLIEEDIYDVEITVEGEDDNGNDQETVWTLLLEVDKESHDLVISSLDVSPSTVKCNNYATVDIEVTNIGNKDEEDVKIVIENDDLDVEIIRENIELEHGTDEDDAVYDRRMQIDIDEDINPGTYPISVKVYTDETKLMDSETTNLIVGECTQRSQPVDVQTIIPAVPTTYPPSVIDDPTTISFRESDEYLMLLAILFVLVTGLVVYGIGAVIIVSKKNRRRY